MAAETKVGLRVVAAGDPCSGGSEGGPKWLVTVDELRDIVQYAYDELGILATPDMGREAARVAEAMPGLCRCGLPDCSDGDTALRAFADRWGQSLRGRS